MRGLLLYLLLCVVPLSCAWSKDITVITAFGDSLSSGYGLTPNEAFPSILENKLLSNGKKVKVINDGIAGDSTTGALARLQKVLDQKPDIAIVELGGNDMMRGVAVSDIRFNLEKILVYLNEARIKVLVVGMYAQPGLGKDYANEFNSLFCELARNHNAPCYPFFLDGVVDHPELMQGDGIHPNSAGVQVIVDKIYPFVTGMMGE